MSTVWSLSIIEKTLPKTDTQMEWKQWF